MRVLSLGLQTTTLVTLSAILGIALLGIALTNDLRTSLAGVG
jgi:hypothetical protein